MQNPLGLASTLLFCGALFAGLSVGWQAATAQGNMPCELADGGMGKCRSEGTSTCFPPVDSSDALGSCYSQRNHRGDWTCVCSVKVLPKPEGRSSTSGPNIDIGIGLGIGGGHHHDHDHHRDQEKDHGGKDNKHETGVDHGKDKGNDQGNHDNGDKSDQPQQQSY